MQRATSGLLTLLSLSALHAGCGGGGDVARPSNLLVIGVDTLRADYLGAYGDPNGLSPEIDALAESGVVFEHALSHASWTLPSFAAVLTSLYSSTHGCWNFDSRLSESFVTLPEIFREAGFETAGIASHVFFDDRYGLQQGFDSFDDELAHRREDEGWVAITSPIVAVKAERWLDERAAQGEGAPWLLWVHFFDPHVPYVDHTGRGLDGPETENERYRSEIAFTDRHVGRVLAALERNGFAADTAVVFLSDHGEAFEEHPGVRRHSRSLYREELWIPLIVRVPGLAPGRVSGLVRTVDLLPTLLEVFGIRPERAVPMEGESLAPALSGARPEPLPLLSEIRLHDGSHARAIVDGRWKLIEDTSNGVVHLFDLESDVDERTDLARDQPELVEELRARMRELVARAELLGELFEGGGRVDLTPEELQWLRDLGYVE